MTPESPATRLAGILAEAGPLAVAVSGGVDSMTLAAVAHQALGRQMLAIHAVSPAVPPQATERVTRYAERFDWALQVVDANEFADLRYRQNPVNRCYYCKSSLYRRMASLTDWQLVSGTNTDDLADFRPGLKAAGEFGVRHPYVEAGIDKQAVRAIAHGLGLDEIAALPAAPCLSSRMETGIEITPNRLRFINDVERFVDDLLSPGAVRCRIRSHGIEIQLDAQSLEKLHESAPQRAQILHAARTDEGLPVTFGLYRMGSATVMQDG